MQASDWRPIEKAPKDGTYVLAYSTGIIGIAWWQRDLGWLEVGIGGVMTPTHWMPLPPPPAQEGA